MSGKIARGSGGYAEGRLRIYTKQNVLEAAKDRIRWLFDEFDVVIPATSGGKDSTVIVELCMEIAREKDRLPLPLLFIDQEAEWQATIDQVRYQMQRPEIEPYWLQVPMVLFNATSTRDHWLRCWHPDDEEKWMREREPYALTENIYGTERFAEMFTEFVHHTFPDQKATIVGGVRTEESPGRFNGMTRDATWKGRTWGKRHSKSRDHFTFYPIYDWGLSDVWKAIHEHGWKYNRLYDYQYQHGTRLANMRVSNVHHETAVGTLFYMQEIEPETFERLTQRIEGIATAAQMGVDDYFPSELPFMFKDWREYRDHLLDKLITDPDWQARFRKIFEKHARIYGDELGDQPEKAHIRSILTNDWEGVKIHNFEISPKVVEVFRRRRERGFTDAEE